VVALGAGTAAPTGAPGCCRRALGTFPIRARAVLLGSADRKTTGEGNVRGVRGELLAWQQRRNQVITREKAIAAIELEIQQAHDANPSRFPTAWIFRRYVQYRTASKRAELQKKATLWEWAERMLREELQKLFGPAVLSRASAQR
jgi:hypothetical protein